MVLWFGGVGAVRAAADGYIDDARRYLEKGEVKSAVIQLKNALQGDPSHVEARLLLAGSYLVLGDAPAAAKEYDRAAQLGAPAERWMAGYARAQLLQGENELLLQRVQPEPGMPPELQAEVQALRGNALLALNRAEEAGQAYEAALSRQPDNAEARLGKVRVTLLAGDREAAVKELDALLADDPALPAALVLRGELARQAGRLDDAAVDFARAVEAAPNNLRAHLGVALVAVAQRRPDDALAAIETIRERFGDIAFTGYLHGLAAFQKGRLDEAAEQLQLVLRAMPSHLQTQLLYGVVSYARGEFRVADDYVSRVASALGENPAVAKLLGAIRLKLREPRRAVDAMQAVSDRFPQDAQLLALLGNAYLQAGDNTRGSEYLSRAIELDPDQALLRTQLALGQLAGGDTDAAISELETAVELGQDIVQTDVLLVLSYLKRGETEKALAAAQALEGRMPESPVPANLTGLAYLAAGSPDEADARFRKALEIDPEFLVAHMNRARTALARGDAGKARASYQEVLQRKPNHLGALLGLAALAQQSRDEQAMQGYLDQAYAANPDALQPRLLLAELQLRRGDALKALTFLGDLTPEQAAQPAVLRLTGMAQLQAGEFNSAVRTLEQLTAASPSYVEGWFQLARAQAAAGDNARARASFRKAIELDKDHRLPIVWVGLGELELRDRRYAEALAHAKEMQAHFPNHPMAYEIEAAAQRGLGNGGAALAAVEKAARAEGTTKRINVLAHSLSAAGRPAQAMTVLEDWLAQHPDDGATWTTLGMMRHQQGDEQAAIQAYESALASTPDNPVVLNNLAWLYHRHGDRRALETAREAYEMAPERPEIVDTYGWVLFQQGKRQAGLNVLQQALVAAPRNPEIGLHVAEALLALGRRDEARPLLQRIQREHPRTEWEQQAAALLSR
jgi:putative PEP-CTERM system TPR-repeat lipoprotein